MPTYEYQCQECGIRFERFQHFSEEPVKTCPECQGTVRRVLHPVGIIFKGSGFYVTDHRGGTSEATLPKPEKKSEEKGNKPEKTPKSDGKPATETVKKES